jgi:hypothetical protein
MGRQQAPHGLGLETIRGPTLSPFALLCLAWVPSQRGNVPDSQHLMAKTQGRIMMKW